MNMVIKLGHRTQPVKPVKEMYKDDHEIYIMGRVCEIIDKKKIATFDIYLKNGEKIRPAGMDFKYDFASIEPELYNLVDFLEKNSTESFELNMYELFLIIEFTGVNENDVSYCVKHEEGIPTPLYLISRREIIDNINNTLATFKYIVRTFFPKAYKRFVETNYMRYWKPVYMPLGRSYEQGYQYKNIIVEDAPIIHAKSIAGLSLDTHIQEFRNWMYYTTWALQFDITKSDLTVSIKYDPSLIEYIYKDGLVTFTVDIFTGKLCYIWCGKGYKGLFLDKIGIGSKFTELIEMDLDFEPHRFHLASPKYPGILFEIPYVLYDAELKNFPKDLTIERIGVFSRYIYGEDNYSFYGPDAYEKYF